jgi:aarF domain-containing kinase
LFIAGILLYYGIGELDERIEFIKRHPHLRKARVLKDAAARFIWSCGTGLAMSFDYRWTVYRYRGTPEWEVELDAWHTRSAKRLVGMCLHNGGLWCKLGQGFASLNHVLPEQWCHELAVLQDKAWRPMSFDTVTQIFLEDFGHEPSYFFAEFEETPVAAASLAQVFRAVTHSGVEVAVKVQYIDMHDRFEGDISTVIFLMNSAAVLHPEFDFGWIVRDSRAELEKELDFINEANNSVRCYNDIKHIGNVHVPELFWQATSKRVMTAEYIHGHKITDLEALRNDQLDVTEVARIMVEAFAHQIFTAGFVHADPHPGNMMVRKMPDGSPQVVLLDHGLYIGIQDTTRRSLCNLWKNIVLHDDEQVRRCTGELGIDPESYRWVASTIFQRPYSTSSIGFKTQVTKADLELMQKISVEHMDKIVDILKAWPHYMALVLRNVNTVRAVVRDLGTPVNRYVLMAKHAVLGAHVESVFEHHIRQEMEKSRSVWQRLHASVDSVRSRIELMRFEWILRIEAFKEILIKWYIRTLQALGRAPENLGIVEEFIVE